MSADRFFPQGDVVSLRLKHDRTAWLKGGGEHCQLPPRTPVGKAWRLVLLGAPGVGKGTQAELLSARLGACHLSTGDVFRGAKNCGDGKISPTLKSAVDFMRRGALVPDETVLGLVAERLRCLSCSGGFLLDGFPRTVAQAGALEKLLQHEQVELTAVFNYELPLAQVVARISGRRLCADCKAVYHITTHPADRCDRCNGQLGQRDDDRPEAVTVRMAAYQASTQPLIDFYAQRGLIVNISAAGSPEEIYKRTRRLALTM